MFLDDAKALGQQSESVLKLGEGKGEPGTAGDIHDDGHKVLGCVTVRMIPWFLFALNLFMAFGAGMTVKFFPIFFSERCKVTPVTLQLVYIALPLVVVCFTVAGIECGASGWHALHSKHTWRSALSLSGTPPSQ